MEVTFQQCRNLERVISFWRGGSSEKTIAIRGGGGGRGGGGAGEEACEKKLVS